MKNSLFALAVLFLFSCGSKLKTGDGKIIYLSRYKSWPDSLSLETYNGGGMVYAWNKVFISKDSCYLIDSEEGNDNRYDFKLSREELDKLFKGLLNNHIEQLGIKKTDGIIYDKGTTSISVKLGNKFVNIGDGASETVSELSPGDFMKSYNLLIGTARGKIAVNKKQCRFNLDKSLRLPSKCLHIIAMTADTSYSDSTHLLKPNVCFNLLPGIQSFQIHMVQKGKVNYTDYFASIYPKFTFKNDTAFTLKLVNDSVLVLE